jgi:2-oxoglutarate ferredoxin oxidoreductase subunit alpha
MGVNPLEDQSLESYTVIQSGRDENDPGGAEGYPMGTKEKDRAKNMFVLGFLYWMYNRNMENTIQFLKDKFGKKA